MLLADKVCIVSGVGPGMGRDIALALAREGAKVVLGARHVEKCEKVADELTALGGEALPLALDITKVESCEDAASAAIDRFGRIDALVNNAFHGGPGQRFDEGDLDKWRLTTDVNLWGTLQMTKAVVPQMKEQGDGRIVMINTMSTARIRETYGAYAASKAALATATQTLAVELGQFGIRVNGIHPGYIWGDSVAWYFDYLAKERGITADEVYAEVADETCLKYLPSSEEIAGSVVFFCSDLSKPVTGQALHVNAGHWLH